MLIETHVVIDALLALGVALIISFLATPFVKRFAYKVGAIDVPKDARRVHNHPIPRLGGLAIYIAFILAVVIFAPINRQTTGILIGSLIIVIMGVVDDIVPLPALLKFSVQILAALVAVYFGVMVDTFSNPNVFSATEYISLGMWSVPLTVIWIVAITNSVNLIDGLDGLAVGVSAIASITMLVVALVLGIGDIAIILAALTGACIGFMPYNMNPAKIFMGDTGALLLGYLLSTLSITGMFKFYAIISFAVPLLALALPLFDTVFVFCRRLSMGKNPMSPDRGHFHHRLLDMGLSQKQVVAVLYSISAVLGVAAVIITTSGELKAIMLLIAFAVALVIGSALIRGGRRSGTDSDNTPEEDN
ncbi:MAG: undecaprenyl/decaprenyl-phosphate alpha-N-acetylglucosaminyl 1-phosphate transferase, partial [Oscillospiraceae bacterium]|nr:undecaprenyl/decaprenyl-phosphate alpha-N-acetylglucosaminyl 1-phosphate transferase [Oscillospiraceae bacterium]